MRKKLLLAMALSGVAGACHATFPDVNSMFQNFAPIAPARAPELNNLIVTINAWAPYPDIQYDALLTLVPLADGSLRAATDGPMRQVMSSISERLLLVDMREESGYAAGDEPVDASKDKATKATSDTAKDSTAKKIESTEKKEESASTEKSDTESKSTETKKSSADDLDDTNNTSDASKIPDLSKAQKVNGVWAQLLGDHIKQHEREGIPGYRADVAGGVIGRDLFLAPRMTVGVAGGYQHARVTQSYLSGSYLDIDRYQGTVYGRYHICDWPVYVVGAATLAANRYENSRYILVPPINGNVFSVIANSEFTGWESDLYFEGGYVYKCGNFRAIPKITLYFSHLDVDSYYESDALALDLTVKYQDMNELQLGVGGKIDYRNRFEKAYVVPEVHAYYFHDFINDSQISTAEFFSGGYAFLSQGPAPAPNSFEVGAALAVHSYRNTVVKLQYDYNGKSTYHRHAAFVKVRYEWA